MKNFQNSKKTGFLKKIFIKLCRILGFEIIDQNTFEIVTIDKKINDEQQLLAKTLLIFP